MINHYLYTNPHFLVDIQIGWVSLALYFFPLSTLEFGNVWNWIWKLRLCSATEITWAKSSIPGWWLSQPSETYEFVSWDDYLYMDSSFSNPPGKYRPVLHGKQLKATGQGHWRWFREMVVWQILSLVTSIKRQMWYIALKRHVWGTTYCHL